MSRWSLNCQQSDITVANISGSFTHKMAAKTSWHRYESNLRHCRPVYKLYLLIYLLILLLLLLLWIILMMIDDDAMMVLFLHSHLKSPPFSPILPTIDSPPSTDSCRYSR